MDQQQQTMDQQQQQQQLPPGFRFYPTEQELITFYLHNKLHSQGPDLHLAIPSIDIYNYDPPQLPGLAGRLCHREIEQWFFFVPQQERERRGGRPNRTTASGYWKATGSPSCVYSSENKVIGVKKTMVFYQGRAPTGTKTKWKMNEYKVALRQEDTLMNNIIDPNNASSSTTSFPKVRNELSLCRVYVTSGCARAFDRRPPPGFVARIHNNNSRYATTNCNQDGNFGNTNQEQEENGANNSQNVDGTTSNAVVLMERSNSSSDSSTSNKSGGNDQMTLQDQEDQDPATVGSCINSHEIGMAEDLDSLWDLENFLL